MFIDVCFLLYGLLSFRVDLFSCGIFSREILLDLYDRFHKAGAASKCFRSWLYEKIYFCLLLNLDCVLFIFYIYIFFYYREVNAFRNLQWIKQQLPHEEFLIWKVYCQTKIQQLYFLCSITPDGWACFHTLGAAGFILGQIHVFILFIFFWITNHSIHHADVD